MILTASTRTAWFAALALALAGCEKPAAAPAMFERPPAAVRVAAAVARDVPLYLDQIGRIAASETVAVRPQVTGKVTGVRFTEGADVRRGDVLVLIDARPFEVRLASATAALAGAQASLDRARTSTLRPRATLDRARAWLAQTKADLARSGALVATHAVSESDHDARKSAVTMAEAEVQQAEADLRTAEPAEAEAAAAVKSAEAAVAAAKLDLEYCTVTAPIDGRAGRRLVDAGNVVTANDSPLVDLARLDPVYAEFSVPEKEVAAIQRHRAGGTLRVEVRIPGDAGAPRTGDLTFLANAVEPTTGTLALRATLPNPGRELWPGQFVEARLVLATLPSAVLVPVEAEGLSANGPFVYVAKDDGTAEIRLVTLGQRQGGLVVVREGVRAGEKVVVQGQFGVTPGGKVNVLADAAPEAGK